MSALSDYQVRLVHSIGDLNQCLSALTWIDELEPDEEISRLELRRYRCLEDDAVLAYWRPFSDSKGLPKLSFKKLGIAPTAAEKALHKELGVHRNKVVAHTDTARMRFALRSWKAFEDRDIFMPHFVRDDSLALFDRRREWMDWVHRLHAQITGIVFEQVQKIGEIDFVADHLRDSPSP